MHCIVPANTTSAVLLLHGAGANGRDLLGLGQAWTPQFPNTAFFSPDALEPCDMGPFGFQWFSLQNRTTQSIAEGLARARPVVDEMIDKILKDFSLSPSAFVLGGFSQGAMLALYTGLQRKEKIVGILAYSGALIGLEHAVTKPPVLLVHGLDDTVVASAGSKQAADFLMKEGVPAELHFIHNLGHSIDPTGLYLGAAFLQRILQDAAAPRWPTALA
jgi:phospholipase/carboxylesterase